MTISRKELQRRDKQGHRSHASGNRASRFAARIKENLDKQFARFEKELCDPGTPRKRHVSA